MDPIWERLLDYGLAVAFAGLAIYWLAVKLDAMQTTAQTREDDLRSRYDGVIHGQQREILDTLEEVGRKVDLMDHRMAAVETAVSACLDKLDKVLATQAEHHTRLTLLESMTVAKP